MSVNLMLTEHIFSRNNYCQYYIILILGSEVHAAILHILPLTKLKYYIMNYEFQNREV